MEFNKYVEKHNSKPKYIKNFIKAFLVGGFICLFAQSLIYLFSEILKFDEDTSKTLTITTIIFLGALLTGLGIYDRVSQFAGAGTIIPISGFANTMTSSAMDYKGDGIVLGIASNMFKLAGSVITFGVVSAYIFGSIRYFIG